MLRNDLRVQSGHVAGVFIPRHELNSAREYLLRLRSGRNYISGDRVRLQICVKQILHVQASSNTQPKAEEVGICGRMENLSRFY